MDDRETSGAGRGRLPVVLLVAVIVAVVMGFAGFALGQRFTPTTHGGASEGGAAPVTTTGWRVYHDPLGLFTMRLPLSWSATSSLGTFSEGGPGGSDSGQTEGITFSDPALGAASPRIEVFAQQIHNPALVCSAAKPGYTSTTTFDGYPADESLPAVILFGSGNAHFQLDETIPGVLVPENPGGPMNPPTPLPPPPAATATAERGLIVAALTTFLPTDAKPLTCGQG
ncbi:MAG: hypothetical protein ACRDID_00680 [Ktedonobacterales bacterium]